MLHSCDERYCNHFECLLATAVLCWSVHCKTISNTTLILRSVARCMRLCISRVYNSLSKNCMHIAPCEECTRPQLVRPAAARVQRVFRRPGNSALCMHRPCSTWGSACDIPYIMVLNCSSMAVPGVVSKGALLLLLLAQVLLNSTARQQLRCGLVATFHIKLGIVCSQAVHVQLDRQIKHAGKADTSAQRGYAVKAHFS